jgi:23S rRNA-/tRNA-specific pseudouridylate synthase
VTRDDAGLRLDQLLAKHVPGLSRRTARKVLLIGGVFVERSRVKIASKIIQPGHKVEVHLGGALETITEAEKSEPLTLNILFEDEHLLVVDKPAQLATAATRESDRHCCTICRCVHRPLSFTRCIGWTWIPAACWSWRKRPMPPMGCPNFSARTI